MKASQHWSWGAEGKHPVVKDYISLGEETPVLRVFSRWVGEGYSRVSGKAPQRSWRFFTRGGKPDELALGLLRDSHDKAGRPYPLLVMGYGRIEGWEKQWELLPRAFEGPWERMEFMSVKRVFDLDELKSDISRLPAPVLESSGGPSEADESLAKALSQGGRDTATLLLDGESDHADTVVRLLKGVKERNLPAPAAVFIGGPQDKVMLSIFMKSLNTADFEGLWNV